ncbi:MAG: CHAT domain-containing tetratricopeptide repeat protein [Pseudomonadota bacterium]|nr:CHAT domain-containing tetratricopeptide repeat protein [Pseudomonadota bacterium]
MKSGAIKCAVCALLFFSSQAQAQCRSEDDRFRAEHLVEVPAGGLLLGIEPGAESLLIELQGPQQSLNYASPAGPALEHFIVLGSELQNESYTVCVYARYPHSSPSTLHLYDMPLRSIPASEIELRTSMSEAYGFWADDTFQSRDEAVQIFANVAAAARSVSEDLMRDALLMMAKAQLRQADFINALDTLSEIIAVPGDPIEDYKTTWATGEARLRLNDLAGAIESLQSAADSIVKIPAEFSDRSSRDLVDIRILLAEALLAARQIELAEEQISLAAEMAGEESRLIGRLHDVMGFLAIRRSEQPGLALAEQRQHLSEAIDIMLAGRIYSGEAADPVPMAAFENNLGFVYDRLGEYRRALIHYRNILDTVDPAEHPLVYRFAYSNLGRLYQVTADYDRSESYYRQSIAFSESSSGAISTTRCALGATLRLSGDIDSALIEQTMCQRQAEATGNQRAMILARYELAESYLAQGDHERAWQNVEWAWQQRQTDISPALRARIMRLYAWLLQRRGSGAQAWATINELLVEQDDDQTRLDMADRIENLAMAMNLSLEQGDMARAEPYGLMAIDLIESQYEQFESERLGPAWGARTHRIFVQLAEAYLKQYLENGEAQLLEKAFAITERSRAATLRQQFAGHQLQGNKTGSGSSQGDDPISRSAEKAQINAISRIANEIANTNAAARIDSSNISLPANYYHHQDVLSLHRLQGVMGMPLPPAMTLAEIQSRIEPNQAALYYLITDSDNYVFTLTDETLTVTQLENLESIGLLDTVREQLAHPDASPYRALADLSGHLLGGISQLQDKTELLIVPHGALHRMPFAALPIPGKPGYTPLISQYTVQILPSLTAFLMDKPLNASNTQLDVAVFADPVFDRDQLTQLVATLDTAEPSELRGWSDSLQRLPNTATEANNLTALFGDDRTQLFTGQRASRGNLARDDVRNAKVLHIATHGYFNADNEDNVGLGLSVIDENGNPDTGFVTLPELFSYRFNNELIVVSGCDTAMGRELAGEGMMGLTRGFIAQGARHVISTLWPVSDRASAEFMAIFYRHLHQTGHVADALKSAQLELQQNPNYRAPFYWAAYVLTSTHQDPQLRFTPTTQ